jgi:peptidoglycan/xylan/chitin deacetylase (PgdA/CDA1 family)
MSLLILIYHRVTENGGGRTNPHCLPMRNFREHMQYLRRSQYPVVSWREPGVDAALQHGEMRVALTFDDGYRSDLECAHVLRSLGYDALFFIATGCLGAESYLDRDGVVELQRLGMTIGSHSHNHVQLTSLDDAQAADDLRRSREVLEDIVQRPIEYFSFPGGAYDGRVLARARAAGYKYFFTSDWGINRKRELSSDLFRRTSVLNHLDTLQFDALLRQRNYYARRVGFRAKELAKKTLGANGYVKLRRALLSLLR